MVYYRDGDDKVFAFKSEPSQAIIQRYNITRTTKKKADELRENVQKQRQAQGA